MTSQSHDALFGRAGETLPIIEQGVEGPHHQDGFLLRAPRSETLFWDLENEVVSARRSWIEEEGAWWVAASYLDTVIDVVLRSFPAVLVRNGTGTEELHTRRG